MLTETQANELKDFLDTPTGRAVRAALEEIHPVRKAAVLALLPADGPNPTADSKLGVIAGFELALQTLFKDLPVFTPEPETGDTDVAQPQW